MAAGMSDYTEIKQRVFEVAVRAHMGSVKSIVRRYRTYARYLYVDLNAGPGFDRSGKEGSPAIVLRVAAELELPIDAWLCERDPAELLRLRARFGNLEGVRILDGDHHETFERIVAAYRRMNAVYGLVYADSNGDLLPVEPLAGLTCGSLSHVDILAHINANGGYKRTRHLHADRYLADDLDRLGKKYLWVRREEEAWQWTFVIASNWAGFPRFGAQGIVPVESESGGAILDRINFSRNERRRSLQPALPFPEMNPTAPTPNT